MRFPSFRPTLLESPDREFLELREAFAAYLTEKGAADFPLAPPKTWEQLRLIALYFKERVPGMVGLVMPTSRKYDQATMSFEQVMWAFGGDFGEHRLQSFDLRSTTLFGEPLAHAVGVLLQLLHPADDHLVHHLAVVAHGEADRLAALDDDVARHRVRGGAGADFGAALAVRRRGHELHAVVHADGDGPARLLRVSGAAERGFLGLRVVEGLGLAVPGVTMAESGRRQRQQGGGGDCCEDGSCVVHCTAPFRKRFVNGRHDPPAFLP